MNQQFYQVKGALPADAPSYIKRDADDMLYNALIEHKYCYVLNYRQVGKSSLKNSCAKRLEKVGHRCIHIDLTRIGSKDIAVEKWYFSFMYTIVKQLNLSERVLINYWLDRNLSIVSRVGLIMDELILKECQDKITIFIDEIDYILSINKFNTDNFFALIRSFYNLRGEDKRYNRLTFVLLGVASPNDLMQDSSRTPFNIAENIKISQLKLEQSYRLMDGLDNQTIDKKEILKKVFGCTSGTSFLTQKILEDISKYPITSLNDIDSIVERLFIEEGFNEVNLSNIQERIIKNQTHNVKMLYAVEQIQNGAKIEDDSRRQTYIYLKLSGLIKVENGFLVYSNLIYKRIFNAFWLEKMIDKLDRPIVKYFRKWTQNGMSDKYLLKKETLQEVEKWAYGRSDLLATEYNYLSLSHQEENRKARIKLEEEKRAIEEKFLEQQSILNERLLEEQKKFNEKILEEKKKYNKKLLKQTNMIIRMRQIFAIIIFFAVGGGISSVVYSVNKNAENEKIKLANTQLESETIERETEKIKLENKAIQLELEAKKKNDYYKNLLKAKLKGGTPEYYLWEIDTYEYLDNNQTNYKIAEASIKLGDIYKENNRPNEAKKFYKKAVYIYLKDNNKYQEELATLYCKLGYLDGALKIYNKNPIRYESQRAKIYYKMTDKFISNKDIKSTEIKQAEELYKKGFEIYRKLLQKDTSNYIHILADSLVKQAKISQLKNNKKEAKRLYKRALNIYKKLDNRIYDYAIKEIKDKLNKLKNIKYRTPKRRTGWVYIGKFVKGEWAKQNFWLEKSNIMALKNSDGIAVSGVNLREKASVNTKRIGGVPIGSIITIIEEPKKEQEKDGTHIWVRIEY